MKFLIVNKQGDVVRRLDDLEQALSLMESQNEGYQLYEKWSGYPSLQEQINAAFPDGVTGTLDEGLKRDLTELEHQFYHDHPLGPPTSTDDPRWDSDKCYHPTCARIPTVFDIDSGRTFCDEHKTNYTLAHRLRSLRES